MRVFFIAVSFLAVVQLGGGCSQNVAVRPPSTTSTWPVM